LKRVHALALLAVSIVLGIAAWSGKPAAESEEAGVELQSYFSNANTTGGQAFVNITAPLEGSATATNPGAQQGEICANIYGFDTAQNLQTCCGCPITADGLLTLSISGNIAPNPVGSTSILIDGSIRILASDPNGNPSAELAAWASHIENSQITESEFLADFPDSSELDELPAACADIIQLGSGAGVCDCGFPTKPTNPAAGCDPATGVCCDPTTFAAGTCFADVDGGCPNCSGAAFPFGSRCADACFPFAFECTDSSTCECSFP